MSYSPQCGNCKNVKIEDGICRAFPTGIPPRIIKGEVDHRQPYPGDHNIQFEPINKARGE